MALAVGTRLGPYEVLGLIGAGGIASDLVGTTDTAPPRSWRSGH